MTPQDVAKRLVPDKAALLVAGVRSLQGVYKDNGIGWLGYIDWFSTAKSIGMHWKRAERTVEKFAALKLQEPRNNYDGWLLPLGLATACLLEPSLRDNRTLLVFAGWVFNPERDQWLDPASDGQRPPAGYHDEDEAVAIVKKGEPAHADSDDMARRTL